MNKFEVFRYIKKWRWMIVLLTLAGIYLVYNYATGNQSYTASVYIKYTNSSAASGLTPNGKPLDVKEIYNSSVIADVINDLGLSSSVESIRNNCDVKEIVPADTQKLIDYALDNGEEYEFFPQTYLISYTCGSSYSSTYALKVLDSIISNYFNFYSDNYISSVATPNNASNVSTSKYDYLECVNMLNGVTNEMITFLNEKVTESWSYRSNATGYSFEDILDIYEYYQEYTIPSLYAYILDNGVTSDVKVLRDKYHNSITRSTLRKDNLSVSIDRLQALLTEYSDKSKQGASDEVTGNRYSAGNTVLGNVFDSNKDANVDTQTTYDQLVLEYAAQKVEYEQLNVDVENAQYTLDAFSGVDGNTDPDDPDAIYLVERISQLADDMNDLYSVLWESVEDYNAYRSAQNISMLTNISARSAINVNLYMLIACVLFGMVGAFSAILLGRVGDLMEYYIYIDRRVGIYNRAKCDMVIDDHKKSMLKDGFCCMSILVRNLAAANVREGRAQCDMLLKTFAGVLSDNINKSAGFIGYNGNGQFIVLLNEATLVRANELFEYILKGYKTIIADKYSAELSEAFDIHAGIACSTEDKEYQIRELLRTAINRAKV